jgi:anti-sigma-K factor RskA
VVHLTSAQGAELAEFVVLRDGRGYMVSAHMPTLPSSQTYQLWAMTGGQLISIGLLGDQPSGATFTLASSAKTDALLLTVEPARGVSTPDHQPVASGAVNT